MTRRRLLARADLLSASLGIALALVSALALFTPAPSAAAPAPASDGSDWGPQGTLSSDSAVTLRWDNTGNPDDDVVDRDSRQPLPHTAGKTYASVAKTIRDAYAASFGADNGLGGLTVTVSETQNLINQGVTVDISGATGGAEVVGGSGAYFQIFQCWGAMGANGKPDPDATSPDPATCQTGVGGADATSSAQGTRTAAGDAAILAGGDWAQAAAAGGGYVPFLSIDGQRMETPPTGNVRFNKTTTNEWSHVVANSQGRASRVFEMQTGSEAPGLGCGERADAPSTPDCWLVVVPRLPQGTIADNDMGPLSPSIWAQRLQVKLTFQDVATGCSVGHAALLTAGSELLGDAMASWRPGACSGVHTTLGYTQLGDAVARVQYASGGSDAILTSEPATPTAQTAAVPVALTAPAIGLTVDYRPSCDASAGLDISTVDTEDGARTCGYPDLAALRADYLKTGTPITDLRLNARLVAKLLTQSYGKAIPPKADDGSGVQGSLGLGANNPGSLFEDPEFRALNPQLDHMTTGGVGDRLVVEAMRSDADAQLWSWILADPAAASFISGCPDPWGATINPFYSSRTYTGCPGDAARYEAAAKKLRDAVPHPVGYVDQPLTYPPDGSPFPVPSYYEWPATKTDAAKTQTDFDPPVDSLSVAARDATLGYEPTNASFCLTTTDPTCAPPPGKWVDPKTRQTYGERQVLVVTDAGAAARYRLPTASLCDDDGDHCVGANTSSLQKAAGRFTLDQASGTLQPPVDVSAFYAAGAYPLTMPVYAAVRTTLPQSERDSYATAFDYVTTTGQTPGFEPGKLAPGYAPLTPALKKLAASGIAAIRAGVPTVGRNATSPGSPQGGSTPGAPDSNPGSPGPSTTATPAPDTPADLNPTGPSPSANAPGGPGPVASGSPTPTAAVVTTPGALAPAAAGTESWPRYTLPLGLAIAVLSGLAGPVLRMRTRWRMR